MDFALIFNRMIRAAKLDVAFYNEVEADTSLNQEALMVVIITAVASGVGSFIGGILLGQGIGGALIGLVFGIVMGIVGYYIWAYLTQFIGTRLFQGTADVGELLRTLGYATAPQILGIFALIPCAGSLVALVGALWSLVAGVVAVREALDLDTGKAVLTVVIGWLVVFVITAIIGGALGLGAAGLGALTETMG